MLPPGSSFPAREACATVALTGDRVPVARQVGARYRLQGEEPPRAGRAGLPHALVSAAEYLPYASDTFDTIVSNEVIEHVHDDRLAMREIVRVLKQGGRAVIFCPNRWYPFETHGHFWRGEYHFGNSPLVNYLPDRWRNQLAPHVRAYTRRGLYQLLEDCPAQVVAYRRIYGGYDNIIARLGGVGRVMRDTLHALEGTPLDTWGLSHFLVIEKI